MIVSFLQIPVALIASLTKLDNLTTLMPFLKVVLRSKATAAYIQGFIPTVILATFMFLLPYILEAMVKVENVKTLSGVDKTVSIRFLYFQVINVLLVSALAGGIWYVHCISTCVHQAHGTTNAFSPLSLVCNLGRRSQRSLIIQICLQACWRKACPGRSFFSATT